MSTTQEIPAEIIADAHEIWAMAQLGPNEGIVDGVDRIARALLARDTATRKECAEIARQAAAKCVEASNAAKAKGDMGAVYRHNTAFWAAGDIATAIEATIGGGNE